MSSANGSMTGRKDSQPGNDAIPIRLAFAGASLGIVVGLIELTVGPSMLDWVGNKQDTTRLGLTTAVLSAIALAAAFALGQDRGETNGRRVAISAALLIPALVCFTTVGRLWYLPGLLLLAAGGIVLATTPRREFAAALDERHWRIGLIVLCGFYYVFLGATALGVTGFLGIFGGLLICAAALAPLRSTSVAYGLLIVGALPFAVATWWSVITPVVAVMVIVLGHGAYRHGHEAAPDRDEPLDGRLSAT